MAADDGSGTQISSITSLGLELPPSCVEFSPLDPTYFLVGTYYLQQDGGSADAARDPGKRQNRSGSIVVFQIVEESLVRIQTVLQPSAILDLHFQSSGGRLDICGAVSSTASLAIFSFSPSSWPSSPLRLLNIARVPAISEDVLFLSFCWLPFAPDQVALTTSTGHVYLVKLGANFGDGANSSKPILTHSLETWCVAVSPVPQLAADSAANDAGAGTFNLFSGGDDSALYYTTCRMISGSQEGAGTDLAVQCLFPAVKMGGHEAGVTAVLPLPLRRESPDLVITGSYDDHIRLFSIEPLHRTGGIRKTRKLAEENLGGGVWRLKLVKATAQDLTSTDGWKILILASCMHAGVRVVELIETPAGDHHFRVLGRFEEHQSMNYGSDMQPGRQGSSIRCVSTSFYDKLLCLWDLNLGS
ncbi:hypothetical protein GQ53DRAFT_746665 [Thozetella sp. PMI_491]|nr:hypothetical protein GQ53DRAFT_746665 [Thozetella sp. PMI_491]